MPRPVTFYLDERRREHDASDGLFYEAECLDHDNGPMIQNPPAPCRDELELTTWELVGRGRGVSAVQLVRAVDLIHAATRELAPFFEKYDAWLTPTLSQPPVPLGVLNQSYGGADECWKFGGR